MVQAKRIHVHFGGRQDTHSCEVGEYETVETIVLRLIGTGKLGDGKPEEIFLFEEDSDDEIPRSEKLPPHIKRCHVHRCRQIEATVIYVDQKKAGHFRPGTTIRKLLKWAKDEFKVDKQTKFDLRLGGPEADPLPLDAHLGSYVEGHSCHVTLYFTPTCRIQG
jgi:hypothetical protein